MTPKLILTLLAIFCIIIAFLLIISAKKNKHKKFIPRKASAKLIKNILGDEGTKYYVYVSGVLFIFFGVGLIYLLHFSTPSIPSGYEQTETIYIHANSLSPFDNSPTVSISQFENVNKLNLHGKYDRDKNNHIIKISFKNNYLSSLPECVNQMSNLKELDIRNNNIKTNHLIDILNKLKNLRKVRLYGNESVNSYNELTQKFPKIDIDTSSVDILENPIAHFPK